MKRNSKDINHLDDLNRLNEIVLISALKEQQKRIDATATTKNSL
jgi:hypothetical protein